MESLGLNELTDCIILEYEETKRIRMLFIYHTHASKNFKYTTVYLYT